ncbi:MAG: rRNA maturation RNase YbeY [Steroidobacteraceae bacterium]
MPTVKKKTKAKTKAKTKSTAVSRAKAKKTSARRVAPAILTLEVQAGIKRIGVPSNKRLQLWAQAAYLVHHAAHSMNVRGTRKRVVPPVQVSLKLVGAAESRKLNREWRDEDHATNVLSFPAGEGFELDELPTLGDLAVCVPVVAREAKQQDITVAAHWAHMMIHGVLHLLGYDHEIERDALVMEACEIAILEQFGFANPYQLTDVKGTR